MKLFRLMALGLLALLLAACGKEEGASAPAEPMTAKQVEKKTDKPDDAINAGIEALKNNNLVAFMQTVLPAQNMDEVREEFEKSKSEAPTEAQKADFVATMSRLTRDGAVDELMAEIEPQLVQMSAQMPMMIGFGQMAAQQAIMESEDISPEQKTAAQETLTATFQKLQGINFADVELARKAVESVVGTARSLDVKTLDELQAMDFDTAMGKAGTVMGGVKEVLNVYGISIDEMLDSVSAEVVSEEGDKATVNVKYAIFGAEQQTQTEMLKVDGRWFSADMIEQIDAAGAMSTMMGTAEPMPQPMPEPDPAG